MKTTALLLILTTAASHGAEWINFIRQTQVDSGVIWDMPVQPTGDSPSRLNLEEGGALFQLWTIEQEQVKDYLLDQRLVGTYLPAAQITIKTGDPYPHVHRTRADQSFTVDIDVSGLLSGQNLPQASLEVLLEHHLAPYHGDTSVMDPREAVAGTPTSQGLLSSNGKHTLKFEASSLPAGDPTAAIGEEHFVVHALPDASIPQTQIASNFVQIWPVATGLIEGISSQDVIRNAVPTITLNLQDLYPSSTTYLQLYRGSASLGTTGQTVDGSVLVIDQDSSAHRVLPIDDWGELLEEDGTHTLELVTVTPFGVERLTYVEFMVDRELEVRAQLGSFETNNPAFITPQEQSPQP